MNSRTPVVFLHAFPLNAAMWDAQRAVLGSRTTLAPDFPGFGNRAVGKSNIDEYARAVLRDMDAAGVERAVVVGLSMGGYVAFRLHALAPDRIAGLVLADTKAGGDDEETRLRRTDQAAKARRDGVAWLEDALLPALLGNTTRGRRPEVVASTRTLIAQAHSEGVARALEAMRARPDSTPQLPSIRVPALVLVGEEDNLTPEAEARTIVEGVRDGQLGVIPQAGHLSNLEAPDKFNEVLLSFLE
ncbi:MAG: alpha/beta fold hydrolase [Gemmatimonadota bacterium]|nr:MAG: alpha/beta fold hydrolase [Gemmatimonadota bacterium]